MTGPRSSAPNRIVLWCVSVLGLAVALDAVAPAIQSNLWIVALAFGAAVLIILTFPGGLLSRSPGMYGPTLLGRLVTLAVLLIYIVSAPFLARQDSLVISIGSVALLWLAIVLMAWRSLRRQASIGVVAAGGAVMLAGVAGLLTGFDLWLEDTRVVGVMVMLAGVAALLYGVSLWLEDPRVALVAILLYSVTMLLAGVESWLLNYQLAGVAVMLFGVAALLTGFDLWLEDVRVAGVAVLLLVVAALLGGVSLWLLNYRLLGVGLLLFVVAVLLFGVSLWLEDTRVAGVAVLLLVVAALLGGVSLWLLNYRLLGVGLLLLAVAALLLAVAALLDDERVAGVAVLLLVVAGVLLLSVAPLLVWGPLWLSNYQPSGVEPLLFVAAIIWVAALFFELASGGAARAWCNRIGHRLLKRLDDDGQSPTHDGEAATNR